MGLSWGLRGFSAFQEQRSQKEEDWYPLTRSVEKWAKNLSPPSAPLPKTDTAPQMRTVRTFGRRVVLLKWSQCAARRRCPT